MVRGRRRADPRGDRDRRRAVRVDAPGLPQHRRDGPGRRPPQRRACCSRPGSRSRCGCRRRRRAAPITATGPSRQRWTHSPVTGSVHPIAPARGEQVGDRRCGSGSGAARRRASTRLGAPRGTKDAGRRDRGPANAAQPTICSSGSRPSPRPAQLEPDWSRSSGARGVLLGERRTPRPQPTGDELGGVVSRRRGPAARPRGVRSTDQVRERVAGVDDEVRGRALVERGVPAEPLPGAPARRPRGRTRPGCRRPPARPPRRRSRRAAALPRRRCRRRSARRPRRPP